MITWATFPFLRYTPALILGIVAYMVLGESWPPLWPGALGLAAASAALLAGAVRRPHPAATDAAGLLALLAVAVLGAALAQRATESRRPDHLAQLGAPVEMYRAVVDDYAVVRPATYATTLRVQAVRVAGRWRTATGGIRVSVPRAGGGAPPRYGEVWLVRGHPDASKGPLNPGEFDYRRYLAFHQVYHQQFVHPDQYRVVGMAPPNYLVAISMRAAKQLDGVFRHYVKAKREYALASALVLGIKDDVDADTKQAYAATGTTHIMAVSGLQVGLLFGALTWLLRLGFGRVRGFRYWSAGVGLAVIWAYAFLTGLSPSVLRAAVMFSFVIVGRAAGRQDGIINTLAVAAFCLLLYDPFLVADVGFQLSFLAVLSIVYLQPRIARWVDAQAYFAGRQRPWQPRPVQAAWRGAGWAAEAVWQATALSLAAQVATFPLGLYYFHQFPLSFLFSNLVAVPISSAAVYVGLALLAMKGVLAVIGLALPAAANAALDLLPQAVAWVFEWMIWAFNEYIGWIGRVLPGALVREIHVTAGQTVLVFGLLGAWLVWQRTRRLAWLGAAASVAVALAGSRVAEARAGAPLEEFVVYSIPRRSVVGFWQGPTAEFVAVDSLPLSETERTYRLLPGLIQRGARAPACRVGWRGAAVPNRRLADADSANPKFYLQTSPVVLARWRGLRLGFVSGRLAPAARPTPLDVLVLRRNARVTPGALAAAFGPQAQVVFDSSCKSWYVARHDSALRAQGFRTWDVAAQGAFRLRPPGR
ncbi:ComEC/Rec2 family competence protein [Hymenobacter nivis]|nr:ComEC/Rec2 family competence protein [Hymenobacter nivis]